MAADQLRPTGDVVGHPVRAAAPPGQKAPSGRPRLEAGVQPPKPAVEARPGDALLQAVNIDTQPARLLAFQPLLPVQPIIQRLCELGFKIYATSGTAAYLRDKGLPISEVLKIHEGRPNARDLMVSGTVDLLINTPLGKLTQRDDYEIRRTALQLRIPYITTLSAARAACDAIFAMRSGEPTVRCLQEWHKELRAAGAVPQDSGAVAG